MKKRLISGSDTDHADSVVLLRALAREARPLGFKYYVAEVGPLSTAVIADAWAKGGVGALHDLVHAVPLGIPFLSLQDDAELASDFPGRDAKGGPFLWGVDQEFIGSPTFHLKRPVDIAPNDSAWAAAENILAGEKAAAAKAEQQRFLLTSASDADFDALAAEFKGVAEAEKIHAGREGGCVALLN